MGGCSTIGYENQNGSVSYSCVPDAGPIDLERLCRTNRYDAFTIVESVEDYFSDMLFEEEDSTCRLLIRLDGTGICRMYGGIGEFLWRPLR
jgi:hypothetical protein